MPADVTDSEFTRSADDGADTPLSKLVVVVEQGFGKSPLERP